MCGSNNYNYIYTNLYIPYTFDRCVQYNIISLKLQVENEEAGLKQAAKLGVACPLVKAHLDSRSIRRGQGSKDRRNKWHEKNNSRYGCYQHQGYGPIRWDM